MTTATYHLELDQVLVTREDDEGKTIFAGVRMKLQEPLLHFQLQPFTRFFDTNGARFSPVVSFISSCCRRSLITNREEEIWFCSGCRTLAQGLRTHAASEEVGDWSGALDLWLAPFLPPLEARFLALQLQDDFEALNGVLTEVFGDSQTPLGTVAEELEAALKAANLKSSP